MNSVTFGRLVSDINEKMLRWSLLFLLAARNRNKQASKMSHWLRHGKDAMSWKACEVSNAARSKITPGSFRAQQWLKCSISTDCIERFSFLIIECSCCWRATGTYSSTPRYPESQVHVNSISNIQQHISVGKKKKENIHNKTILVLRVRGFTFTKCFLNIFLSLLNFHFSSCK